LEQFLLLSAGLTKWKKDGFGSFLFGSDDDDDDDDDSKEIHERT
jgi:hypothetical protein